MLYTDKEYQRNSSTLSGYRTYPRRINYYGMFFDQMPGL